VHMEPFREESTIEKPTSHAAAGLIR